MEQYVDLNLNKQVLIYGDLILDKYTIGTVDRLSPEAPVPIVRVHTEYSSLGGAANVANNISKLGNNPLLIGFLGKDKNADAIVALSKQEGVTLETLDTNKDTTTKVRIVGGYQQVVRLDFETNLNLNEDNHRALEDKIDTCINNNIGVAIISDYLKGACTFKACQAIIEHCTAFGIPVIVDPKGTNWHKYEGAYMLTPNLKELELITNSTIENTEEQITQAAQGLLYRYDVDYILVTRSEKGMLLVSTDKAINFPTEAKEVYDVSGAGDTVIATVALGIALHMGVEAAVRMANTAAGIVVSKFGTTSIYKEELVKAMSVGPTKLVTEAELATIVTQERRKGKRIVFTNGCFDIIHKGHLSYLREASRLGDVFILGLNSDSSIKKLKGNSRPINNEKDRADVLSFLDFIDYITIFDEETPLELIKGIRPDVLTKGGDYTAEGVIGKEFSSSVEIVPFIEGYSTTDIIDKKGREDRVLFLDRDGVINKRIVDGYVTTTEGFEFLPRAAEAIRELNKHFSRVFIVTNQQGVAKGLMTEEELKAIHRHMLRIIRDERGVIDEVYYCPHAEGCRCRKPEIGMYKWALRDFPDIKNKLLYMVGDSPSDAQFAKNLKATSITISDTYSLHNFAEEVKEVIMNSKEATCGR